MIVVVVVAVATVENGALGDVRQRLSMEAVHPYLSFPVDLLVLVLSTLRTRDLLLRRRSVREVVLGFVTPLRRYLKAQWSLGYLNGALLRQTREVYNMYK